jgi:hypothetical protein
VLPWPPSSETTSTPPARWPRALVPTRPTCATRCIKEWHEILRRRGAARLVLAVPVAPHDTLATLRHEVDEVICLAEPTPFHAIGLHDADFHQLSDAQVIEALQAGGDRAGAAP